MSSNIADVEGVDFYFLQDGAINEFSGKRYATDEEVHESAQVFRDCPLPRKTIKVMDTNLQCALQKKHQLETLFEKYDFVVLADNDLVFNRHYIRTIKTLYEQFKHNLKIGSIQCSFRHTGNNFQTKEEAKKLEDTVSIGFSHRWEIGIYRRAWEKMKEHMEPFFELTAECDFKELLYGSKYPEIQKQLLEKYGTEHADYALEKCVERAGMVGIHTNTLRLKGIGERGFYSFRASRFRDGGYGKIELHNVGDVERYRIV